MFLPQTGRAEEVCWNGLEKGNWSLSEGQGARKTQYEDIWVT